MRVISCKLISSADIIAQTLSPTQGSIIYVQGEGQPLQRLGRILTRDGISVIGYIGLADISAILKISVIGIG